MNSRYIIGIDLGTTNSVVAWIDTQEQIEKREIHIFAIPQLVKAGQVREQNTLPSFIYLPGEHELAKGSLDLPWDKKKNYAIGEFARNQGSQVPDRLVSSAKSWLSHPGVDRKSNLLPFQTTVSDIEKLSPVTASKRYLEHIKECWNHNIGKKKENLENQTIYLTVPASFDAVAKELTVIAAEEAGLQVTLLEEPQAAFYSWIYHHQKEWREQLKVNDLVLVIDVGGGTTDLSLISVSDNEGSLSLERIAVGNHILLGGDNMDLTLSHLVSGKLSKAKLDAWQTLSLWHSCREAKEKILADEKMDKTTVSILGRGSSIIGGTLKAKLMRKEVENLLLEGFFLTIGINESNINMRRIGLSQMNLPYASDPAITKHIAQFLKQNAREGEEFLSPTAILFNGGVFKAKVFQEHVITVINNWLQVADQAPLKILQGSDFDLAVAQGAVYYGQVKIGEGIRIRGGTAHSYYLGIETSMPAVPGIPAPMKALCVVPHGMEEGTEQEVPEMEFGLTVGELVEFPFFYSTQRKNDQIGQIIQEIGEDLISNSFLEISLATTENFQQGQVVPIKLRSHVTEVGTLEIFCCSVDKEHQWKLEFNIRHLSS